MTNLAQPPVIGFRPFLVMALVWPAFAYVAGQQIASLRFGFVVVSPDQKGIETGRFPQ